MCVMYIISIMCVYSPQHLITWGIMSLKVKTQTCQLT